ncbi:MAG: AsmA family protein, partial [Gemmatimonadota bacterium]
MNRKRLVLILALPIVLVVAAASIVLLFPAERVAAIAARHAETALGREVRIDRVSIDLFPTPGVALEGVAIAGAEA